MSTDIAKKTAELAEHLAICGTNWSKKNMPAIAYSLEEVAGVVQSALAANLSGAVTAYLQLKDLRR